MNLKEIIKAELNSVKDKTVWLSAIIAVAGANFCLYIVESFYKGALPGWFLAVFMIIYSLIIYNKMYNYLDSVKNDTKSLNSLMV